MGIEVIKTLQKEVETLKQEVEATKTNAEKQVEDLQKEFDSKLTERKTAFGEKETVSETKMKSVKQKAGDLYLKSVLTGRPVSDFKEYKGIADIVEKAIKPSDITAWIGEEFSNQVVQELELNLKVEGLFNKIKMPENRGTFSIPARTENAQAYLIAPAQDAIESAIQGGKISFQTNRVKTLLSVADQSDQEMVTAIVDLIRKELTRSLLRASEKAIIDGDTATADGNDVRKAFDGLLISAENAGNKVDAGGNPITKEMINNARKLLGVYGLNPADLVLIAPVNVAFELLEMDGVETVDKYGAMATLVKGEIARIFGIPIVYSEYVPADLNNTGAHASDGTFTAVLLVNKNYFLVADRENISIEKDRSISSSVDIFVGYRDLDFKKIAVNATPVSAIIDTPAS